jgi:hypothetical protein
VIASRTISTRMTTPMMTVAEKLEAEIESAPAAAGAVAEEAARGVVVCIVLGCGWDKWVVGRGPEEVGTVPAAAERPSGTVSAVGCAPPGNVLIAITPGIVPAIASANLSTSGVRGSRGWWSEAR